MAPPSSGPIEWLADVSEAAWVEERLRFFMGHVGSLVPDDHEAYLRLFHPLETEDGPQRWSDLAARNGRTAHAQMQFPQISGASSAGIHLGPWTGDLPVRERRVLVTHLQRFTTTPDDCWFAVWEGGGVGAQRSVERLEVIQRKYLAFRGPLSLAMAPLPAGPQVWRVGTTQSGSSEPWWKHHPRCETIDQSPNLWWPQDRAWFVHTEVDLSSTYVAGSRALVDSLLAEPNLECLRAATTDLVALDSDLINS
jgi:hypothetical protein